MSISTETLTAQFPRAVRGYAVEAVDDFVRQIGERLDTLQARLNQSEAECTRLRTELESAQNNLTALLSREQAIAAGIVTAEQRKVEVENEIELMRVEAELGRSRIVESGMDEAGRIVAEAQRKADEMLAAAERKTLDQNRRVEELTEQYQQIAAQLRRQLQSQLALLGTEVRPTAEQQNEETNLVAA